MPRSSGNRTKYGTKHGGTSEFGTKGYIISRSQDRTEPNEGSGGKFDIQMSNIRKGDQSSEEYILHDNKSSAQQEDDHSGHEGKGIHKTVQYTVEYSSSKGEKSKW